MAKRLSDTASVKGIPIDGQSETHYTVKPVTGGYSVRKSIYDGNGGYSSAEHFHESEPCIVSPGRDAVQGPAKDNGASSYLKQSRYKERGRGR